MWSALNGVSGDQPYLSSAAPGESIPTWLLRRTLFILSRNYSPLVGIQPIRDLIEAQTGIRIGERLMRSILTDFTSLTSYELVLVRGQPETEMAPPGGWQGRPVGPARQGDQQTQYVTPLVALTLGERMQGPNFNSFASTRPRAAFASTQVAPVTPVSNHSASSTLIVPRLDGARMPYIHQPTASSFVLQHTNTWSDRRARSSSPVADRRKSYRDRSPRTADAERRPGSTASSPITIGSSESSLGRSHVDSSIADATVLGDVTTHEKEFPIHLERLNVAEPFLQNSVDNDRRYVTQAEEGLSSLGRMEHLNIGDRAEYLGEPYDCSTDEWGGIVESIETDSVETIPTPLPYAAPDPFPRGRSRPRLLRDRLDRSLSPHRHPREVARAARSIRNRSPPSSSLNRETEGETSDATQFFGYDPLVPQPPVSYLRSRRFAPSETQGHNDEHAGLAAGRQQTVWVTPDPNADTGVFAKSVGFQGQNRDTVGQRERNRVESSLLTSCDRTIPPPLQRDQGRKETLQSMIDSELDRLNNNDFTFPIDTDDNRIRFDPHAHVPDPAEYSLRYHARGHDHHMARTASPETFGSPPRPSVYRNDSEENLCYWSNEDGFEWDMVPFSDPHAPSPGASSSSKEVKQEPSPPPEIGMIDTLGVRVTRAATAAWRERERLLKANMGR